MKPVKVAMIGVGDISGIYLQNIANVFREVELYGVCDLIPERARKGVSYKMCIRDRINIVIDLNFTNGLFFKYTFKSKPGIEVNDTIVSRQIHRNTFVFINNVLQDVYKRQSLAYLP